MRKRYVAKERELAVLQFLTDEKNDEIQTLHKDLKNESNKIEVLEVELEQHSGIFDEFLRVNDRSTVAAIAEAEHQMNLRLAKEDEFRDLEKKLMREHAHILKTEAKIEECQKYRDFLRSLLPRSKATESFDDVNDSKFDAFQEENEVISDLQANIEKPESSERRIENVCKSGDEKSEAETFPRQQEVLTTVLKAVFKFQRRLHTKPVSQSSRSNARISEKDGKSEPDEKDILEYFKNPQQILTIMSELEEENLHLSQDCQDAEETYEALRKASLIEKKRSDQEIESLENRMRSLQNALEQSKSRLMEQSAMTEQTSDDRTGIRKMEVDFKKTSTLIVDIYSQFFADKYSSLGPLQMLAAIENAIEDLLEKLVTFPSQDVKKVKLEYEKRRKEQRRMDNIQLEKRKQEGRIERALRRSNAISDNKIGRRVIFRSEPKHEHISGESDKKDDS